MKKHHPHIVDVDHRSTNTIVENTCMDTIILAKSDDGIIEPYPTVLCVTNEK